MATNQSWNILSATPVTVITSSSSLGTGNTLLSSAIDNTVADNDPSWIWADFVLNLPNGTATTLTVEQPVELYIVPAVDGANYLDFSTGFTDILAPQNLFRGAFMVRAEAVTSTSQRLGLLDVLIPPYNFKVGIRNNTGVSLSDGSTHFTVAMVRKTTQFE